MVMPTELLSLKGKKAMSYFLTMMYTSDYIQKMRLYHPIQYMVKLYIAEKKLLKLMQKILMRITKLQLQYLIAEQ